MSAVQHGHEGAAAASSSEAAEKPTEMESGNVDKIREILFGGQMRDYDKRFARLEERLIKESSELREDSRRRFEALETFVNKEFAALGQRLQAEQQSREGSVQTVSRELQEVIKSLDAKLTQFYNQSTETQHDLRQQLLDQSKNLNEEIRRKHEDVSATLERELAQLNHEKTDRASLSALFTEVALRLNNDFKIPGGN
jgi:exonuclease VII large subunit